MLKSIVMPINLQIVCNYVFDSIIVPHHIDSVHNSKLSTFWEDLVVMTCYQHVWYCNAGSNFNFAIMTSQNNTFAWLHQGHADRMILNINWTPNSSSILILTSTTSSRCMSLVSKLHIRHSSTSRLVSKCISEILLEI